MTMNTKDHIEALTHAALIRAGLMDATSPAVHPAAAAHVNSSGHLIEELADFCAGLAANGRPSGAIRVNGMATDDFKNAMATILRVSAQRQLDASSDYLALCHTVSLPNFQEQRIVGSRFDAELIEVNELGEFTDAGAIDAAPQVAKLRSYGRNVFLSRQLLRNDDIGLITSSFASYGGATARLEARLVFDLLNANPNLVDAAAMFHVDHGNLLSTVGGFSETALSTAMGMLRSRAFDSLDAEPQNVSAAVVVVGSPAELIAKKAVFESGLQLQVVASPRIAAGEWFLLPDPAKTPVVGLLRLAGSQSPLNINSTRDIKNRDGVLMAVRADTGVVALSRFAIKGVTT